MPPGHSCNGDHRSARLTSPPRCRPQDDGRHHRRGFVGIALRSRAAGVAAAAPAPPRTALDTAARRLHHAPLPAEFRYPDLSRQSAARRRRRVRHVRTRPPGEVRDPPERRVRACVPSPASSAKQVANPGHSSSRAGRAAVSVGADRPSRESNPGLRAPRDQLAPIRGARTALLAVAVAVAIHVRSPARIRSDRLGIDPCTGFHPSGRSSKY